MASASDVCSSDYVYDFYITSCEENTEWIETTCKYLEKNNLKGCFEARDKIGGVPKVELAQYFIKNSHKIIIGFDKPDQREKFKSLDALEDIFGKNDTNDSYRLIPVQMYQDSVVPEIHQQSHVLEAWKKNFQTQLLKSVKFKGASGSQSGTGHYSGGRRRGAVQNNGTMTEKQVDLLRNNMDSFAKDLPYQKVLDRMSKVFSLEDESEIKKESLTDFQKRRKLIAILLTKDTHAYDKFVNTLQKVSSHLAKPLKEGISSRKDVTSAMKDMKLQ